MLTEEEWSRVTGPLEAAWTLPPRAYTSSDIFAEEMRRIFHRDWICVARESQLPDPGDYLCVDLVDQPIVVARDTQGSLHAMSRICLHRAMPLVEDQGNAGRFVCPYHNWTYELDGRLRSAPMMEGAAGFDPAACRLPQLAVEVWQGFVFVNLRGNEAPPLGPRLSGLAEQIRDYGLGDLHIAGTLEFDSPWNWKILAENFMEAYHHIGTHRHTFEPEYPARDSVVADNGGEPWSLLRMPSIKREPLGPDELPLLSTLPEAQRHQLLACSVYPTLLFAGSASSGVWYQLEPRSAGDMHLKIHLLLEPETIAKSAAAIGAMMEGIRFIHEEDIAVNAGPWRGLQAPLTTQGRLSPFEAAIWQMNQLWTQRMRSGESG